MNLDTYNDAKLEFEKDFVEDDTVTSSSDELMVSYGFINNDIKDEPISPDFRSYGRPTQVAIPSKLGPKVRFPCDLCDKTFAFKKGMVRHRNLHTKEKVFKCYACDMVCYDSSSLKKHINNVHTKAKRYQCVECFKSYTDPSTLRQHMKLHTGEKAYKCDECGKAFVSRSHLNKHKTTHTGEKLHKCEVCNKFFREAATVRRHKIMHSGENTVDCHLCGKKFGDNSGLSKHLKTHIKHTTSLAVPHADKDELPAKSYNSIS